VADPRVDGHHKSVQMGVRAWDEPAGVVTGKMFVGGGPHSVADPRVGESGPRFNNVFRIVRWGEPSPAVSGPAGNAAAAVADPRAPQRDDYKQNKYRITRMDEAAGAVIAASTTGNGAFAVADPRTGPSPTSADEGQYKNSYRLIAWDEPSRTISSGHSPSNGGYSVADPRPVALSDEGRAAYLTGGHYGVVSWDQPSGAVPSSAKNNNGPWSVADPRVPGATDHLICVIRSLDDTWHRPFTTLELAALQSLFDPEDRFELDGSSDSAWRERIGNAVPSAAAQAIASTMGTTLLLAWSGETFMLSAQPIWVRPLAIALSVDARREEAA
jgi:site-specific DNA-cytosine methylase